MLRKILIFSRIELTYKFNISKVRHLLEMGINVSNNNLKCNSFKKFKVKKRTLCVNFHPITNQSYVEFL